jgi:NAD(P)-dependent dehydrogenase (short-subunit alcohol dehydrogenase family)
MLLNGKIGMLYGAGGAVGSAVARAFGREGARLFLSGRTLGARRGRRERHSRHGRSGARKAVAPRLRA